MEGAGMTGSRIRGRGSSVELQMLNYQHIYSTDRYNYF